MGERQNAIINLKLLINLQCTQKQKLEHAEEWLLVLFRGMVGGIVAQSVGLQGVA